ncbi:hypothetical protein H0H81_008471 [Sphagnurus paluster]|uniref:Uncharacterized protein n=1 Tax=Sphagnurus paluster TaxID=117069 RepID=A0A9P7GKL0_9AGAR|nr:hypothetical protein H0H81_008471 [Sphagnurus paluster]
MNMNTYLDSEPPKGLILVYSDPGVNVLEEEYHDWYDNEHIPPRLEVPGVLSSFRYRAMDSQSPAWLALYDITSLEVAQTPKYKSLGSKGSQREKKIMADLASINRRVYDQVLSHMHPDAKVESLPGRYVFADHTKVKRGDQEDFNQWYNAEQMSFLAKIPGWLRGRRYELLESVSRGIKIEPNIDEEPYVEYLALHEFELENFLRLQEYKSAIETPWAERAMKLVAYRQLRLFERYKIFRKP